MLVAALVVGLGVALVVAERRRSVVVVGGVDLTGAGDVTVGLVGPGWKSGRATRRRPLARPKHLGGAQTWRIHNT